VHLRRVAAENLAAPDVDSFDVVFVVEVNLRESTPLGSYSTRLPLTYCPSISGRGLQSSELRRVAQDGFDTLDVVFVVEVGSVKNLAHSRRRLQDLPTTPFVDEG
jgi:hypothetical protein